MAISPATRRTVLPKVEPSKDNTKTKVVVPEGTKAEVTEQIGAKTVTYSAEIKEDETSTPQTDDLSEIETDLLPFEEPDYEEVPKNKLDSFFDNIENAQETENQVFFANVTRLPDALSDNFNYPCSAEMPLGVFQFSLRDRFTFLSAIQKKNNNSGGYFNITVYDRDNKPLQKFIGYDFERGRRIPKLITVGIRNLLVANPAKEETENNNNNSTSLLQVLVQMNQKSDERLEKLLVALKPEKSVFEKALEQKMMNDILNPPEKKTGFSMEETMSEVMKSAVVMSSFGDAFSKMLNKEPAIPPPPTTMDTIKEVMNFPLVRDAGEMLLNTLDTIATQKLVANSNTVQPNQLEGATEGNSNEMELIVKIVNELESENEITVDNPTIQTLIKDFPEQFNDLKTMCVVCNFEQIFSLLLTKSQKINPSPFAQFIDQEKTQQQKVLVWNERGEKIIPRLQQVYMLIKEMP